MAARGVAAGLGLMALGACCVALAPSGTPAFLQAAGPVPQPAASPRSSGASLRAAAGGSSDGPSRATSFVGLAAVAVAAAALRAGRAGRKAGGYSQASIVPSGETTSVLTKEEEEAFLQQRVSGMEAHMPMSSEEFEDEVSELTWQWGRNLLPYVDAQRHDLAAFKRRTILKQGSFFQKMRLFKPLAMKHPTMMKRLNIMEYGHIENKAWEINAPWIKNEESIAGFSYEDFAQETAGNTYDNWELPQLDDIVSGKVVALNEDGAFIEVGAKTWAFLPTKLCSLAPVAMASEVLSIGEEIEAKVVSTNAQSMIPGDPSATQMVLSVVELQAESAWDEIEAIVRGEEGSEPIQEVMVKQLKPFGAIVQTKSGLEGLIPNSHLADKVGDTSIVGRPLAVEVLFVRRELAGQQAFRPSDFALGFTHRNAATKTLARGLEEGQVVDATVAEVADARLDVTVNGVRCSMRKVDISSGVFDISEIFAAGEEIKVYVLASNPESGEVRLSTRALEYKRRSLIVNKARVFERAEETAKVYFEKSQVAKAKKAKELQSMLATLSEDMPSEDEASQDESETF